MNIENFILYVGERVSQTYFKDLERNRGILTDVLKTGGVESISDYFNDSLSVLYLSYLVRTFDSKHTVIESGKVKEYLNSLQDDLYFNNFVLEATFYLNTREKIKENFSGYTMSLIGIVEPLVFRC